MRLNSPKQVSHRPAEKWQTAGVLLNAPAAGTAWDPRVAFETPGPVEIEIGVGKGTFLLDRARRRPEINLLGVEYAGAYAKYAADRISRAGLTNAKMLCCDAGPLLKSSLPDACCQRVHIYFPDPWPKRRHRRRRLIQPALLRSAVRVLRPGGQLLIVTDHRDYFEQIRDALGVVDRLATIPLPRLHDGEHIVGTNFEKKYAREGRPIFAVARLRY